MGAWEAKLEFEGIAEVGGVVGDGGVFAGGVVYPGEGEVVEACETCLVDDRAKHGGEAGHGGDGGSKEGERNGASAVVLAGVG